MLRSNNYNTNMAFNLKIFLNILLFSSGPQDLPASANLLKIIIILNIVGLMAVDPNIDITVNIFFALIYILVTLVFIRVCLNLKDKTNQGSSYSSRYLQDYRHSRSSCINCTVYKRYSNEWFLN